MATILPAVWTVALFDQVWRQGFGAMFEWSNVKNEEYEEYDLLL